MSKKSCNNTIVKNRTKAFISQAGRCFYCNQPIWTKSSNKFCNKYGISKEEAAFLKCTAEHVIARQDGGTNVRQNIVAACLFCNRTRHQAHNALSSKKYRTQVLNRMSQKNWHPVIIS